MKKYIITKSTDAYHASRMAVKGAVLKRDGATPVKWIYDDNYGFGYTLNEARRMLNGYYREDGGTASEGCHHKYFELYYEDDVVTYRAEPAERYEVVSATPNGWVRYRGFNLEEAVRELVEGLEGGISFDLHVNGRRVWSGRTDEPVTAEDIMNELNG